MTGSAIIIGASGGIGSAMESALTEEESYAQIIGLAQTRTGAQHIDILDEQSVAEAAARVATGPAPSLIFVATGILHDQFHRPEKGLDDLDPAWLAQVYAVNLIGPALVAKHFMPLMPKTGRTIFAVLSARVGSITENRLGGWHGYRASKAALNQLVRTLAIEERRRNSSAIVVALHPGTVDTALSRPFQANVPKGQLITPDRAAVQMLDVLDGLKAPDSGRHFGWDGAEILP